jgi:hypothetical protein
MRHRLQFVIAVASVVTLAGPLRVDAQDETLSSDPTFSPPSAPETGPPAWTTPARVAGQDRGVEARRWAQRNGGWLGERPDTGRPPTLDELRAHLISRGIDPVAIDQRIARIREARRRGLAVREAAGVDIPPDAKPDAVPRSDRGVEPTTVVEPRLARLRDSRGDFGRFGRQVPVNAGWEQAQLQSRLVRQGIPPQTLNARLGRLDGVSPDGTAPVGPAVGGGAGRIRSRR